MKMMTSEEQKEFIENIGFVQQIKKLPFVEQVILFGSRARGNAGKFSDIDITVVCPRATIQEWFEVIDIVDNAPTLLSIDCVRFDEVDKDLQQKIKKEGTVL
jgi:uncharacterized protein